MVSLVGFIVIIAVLVPKCALLWGFFSFWGVSYFLAGFNGITHLVLVFIRFGLV